MHSHASLSSPDKVWLRGSNESLFFFFFILSFFFFFLFQKDPRAGLVNAIIFHFFHFTLVTITLLVSTILQQNFLYYFMLYDKIWKYIFAFYFMLIAVTRLWVLFHAIYLNKLFSIFFTDGRQVSYWAILVNALILQIFHFMLVRTRHNFGKYNITYHVMLYDKMLA